ncbi:Type IV secretion-system coupling protein DNA-binding domain-containing protein [Raineyella antarctica]|uniref:Type IV secretion-system coupling protein DNA-binding domain-containing protein n=1 Tax=Raineyella antarctica TaxID=1577474 RepID=A0A1G6GZ52_9ACTN|nr:type IV secretion system DNA-binding domain-containing protein [Raineyella antarctica]SDB87289.1 Type IV secretion-system coupling protein DNA-binding domain-containing protein [Raineyella antarctica]
MTRPDLHWTQLHFDQGVDQAQVHDSLTALAVLPFAPLVVLELIGRHGQVSWRIGAHAKDVSAVRRALAAHILGLRLTDETSGGTLDRLRLAAAVRLGGWSLPLRKESAEPVARGLYRVLAGTTSDEMIRIQLVLGQRFTPRRLRDDEPAGAESARHVAEHGFRVSLRVGVNAKSEARARALVRDVGSAWRALEVPGVIVELWRTNPRTVTDVRAPGWWSLRLRVDDLARLVGWPITPDLPGLPAAHPRLLAPVGALKSGRRLGIAQADPSAVVRVSVEDSLRHLHVIGPTGVGKSTLLAHLALQDAAEGRGLVVIDPKGDLVRDILARLPEDRRDDVVVLDPTAKHVVGIDALGGPAPDLAADTILSVFHALYADSWGPRTQDIMHASLLTLARAGGLPLALVPALLTNDGFRHQLIGRLAADDPLGVGAFWSWYAAQSDAMRTHAIAPLMNKLRPLMMRPGLRATFGQQDPRFALRDVFAKRRIVLVSLAAGRLGPDGAQLLGSLVVALLWQAALERVQVPAERRHPVMVYIDEVQDYLHLPGSLSDALAQARGLGVGFTLAHQHLGQLPPSLESALFANARSRVSFTLSSKDARTLASTANGLLVPEDFTSLPAYHAYAQLLVEGSPTHPVSLLTEPLAPPIRRAADLAEASSKTYGRTVAEVDARLTALATGTDPQDVQNPPPATPANTAAQNPSAVSTDAPKDGERFGRRRRTTPTTTPRKENPDDN